MCLITFSPYWMWNRGTFGSNIFHSSHLANPDPIQERKKNLVSNGIIGVRITSEREKKGLTG